MTRKAAQSQPHWILLSLGTLLVALLGYIAAVGGPEKAWLGFRAVVWGHPAPKIVSLEAQRDAKAVFILTIRNPALQDVVITGYAASALAIAHAEAADVNVSEPVTEGAGNAPLIRADEQEPNECGQPRKVSLPRPIVIEPGRTVAIQIHPWDPPCPFEVQVLSDHGASNKMDTFEALFRQFGLNRDDLK